MKISRFKYSYRQNSSKLHKKIGDLLRKKGGYFSTYKIYQEYPVNKINPGYSNSSHKFDWVVLDLYLVIECHGKQHYYPVSFGGIDQEQAIDNLASQKYRDNQKMDAAVNVGFTYIVIPFMDYDKIDEDYILRLYKNNLNNIPLIEKKKEENKYEDDIKERAKKYRREQYRKQKRFFDEIKQRRSKHDPQTNRH